MHQIINSSISVSSDDHLIRTAEKQERFYSFSISNWIVTRRIIDNCYISANPGFTRFSALNQYKCLLLNWFDWYWRCRFGWRVGIDDLKAFHTTLKLWFQGFSILSSLRVDTGDSESIGNWFGKYNSYLIY